MDFETLNVFLNAQWPSMLENKNLFLQDLPVSILHLQTGTTEQPTCSSTYCQEGPYPCSLNSIKQEEKVPNANLEETSSFQYSRVKTSSFQYSRQNQCSLSQHTICGQSQLMQHWDFITLDIHVSHILGWNRGIRSSIWFMKSLNTKLSCDGPWVKKKIRSNDVTGKW